MESRSPGLISVLTQLALVALLGSTAVVGLELGVMRLADWGWFTVAWSSFVCSTIEMGWNLGFLSWLMLRASGRIAASLIGAGPVRNPVVRSRFAELFEGSSKKGRAPALFWLKGRGKSSAANALMLGDRLLISRTIAENLPAEELDAVLLHEIAHFELGHLKERAGLVLLVVAAFWLPWEGFGRWLGFEFPSLLLRLGLFLLGAWALRWLIRAQELEADAWAAARLGHREALCRSLEWVTRWNRQDPEKLSRWRFLSPIAGHPSCVERVSRIRGGVLPEVRLRFNPGLASACIAGALALSSSLWVEQVHGPQLAVFAVKSRNLSLLRRLRAEGVDLRRRDWARSGETPLEASFASEQEQVRDWLVEMMLQGQGGRRPAAEKTQ